MCASESVYADSWVAAESIPAPGFQLAEVQPRSPSPMELLASGCTDGLDCTIVQWGDS